MAGRIDRRKEDQVRQNDNRERRGGRKVQEVQFAGTDPTEPDM
jgi:hypothetical protein